MYSRPKDVKAQDYPEIPEGSYLNFNGKTGTFQVYCYSTNKAGKRIKISIGTIGRDLVFSFSDLYLAKQKIKELQQEKGKLEELLKSNGIDIVQETPAPPSSASEEEIEKSKEEITNSGEAEKQNAIDHEIEKVDEAKSTADGTCEKPDIDVGEESHVVLPFDELACIAMMSSLDGHLDACSMSMYYTTHRAWLVDHLLSSESPDFISPATFRLHLQLLDPKRFEEFYSELVGKLLIQNSEKICASVFDGQFGHHAERAGDNNPKYFLNDSNAGVILSLYQNPTLRKKNEIPVSFQLLDAIDIRGAVVRADTLNIQPCFASSVLRAGAAYCLSVKENRGYMATELATVFSAVHPDHVKVDTFECERDLERVEWKTVKVIPGRFLSTPLKSIWRGLAEGSVAMVTREGKRKRYRRLPVKTWYYLTSLSDCQPNIFSEIERRHWAMENKMHWLFDCDFPQNLICGSSENYLSNCSELNKLVLGILYRYQEWLRAKGEEITLSQLRNRMTNPKSCLEAMVVAFGLS